MLLIPILCASIDSISMETPQNKDLAQLDLCFNQASQMPYVSTNDIANLLKLALVARVSFPSILSRIKKLASEKLILSEPIQTKYYFFILNSFFDRVLFTKQHKDYAENVILDAIFPCLQAINYDQLHPVTQQPSHACVDHFFSDELMSTDSDTISLKY